MTLPSMKERPPATLATPGDGSLYVLVGDAVGVVFAKDVEGFIAKAKKLAAIASSLACSVDGQHFFAWRAGKPCPVCMGPPPSTPEGGAR